jgi:hypothetical protein
MRNREPVKVRINGRIIVNAAGFWKMNLNYFKPTVINLDFAYGFDILVYIKPFGYASSNKDFSKASFDNVLIVTSFDLASESPYNQPKDSIIKQAKIPDKYLLICCLIVLGFTFRDKL